VRGEGERKGARREDEGSEGGGDDRLKRKTRGLFESSCSLSSFLSREKKKGLESALSHRCIASRNSAREQEQARGRVGKAEET